MKILISSLGRCGSTMLYNRIPLSPKRFKVSGDNLKEGLTKSHCYAPNQLDGKAIFLFGNIFDIVKTSYNKIITKVERGVHFQNFQVKTDYEYQLKILTKDVLKLEEHFDSWYKQHDFPCLTMDYNYIWDYKEQIEDFIGMHLTLPDKRKRKSINISDNDQELIYNTYKEFQNKIDDSEKFKIWN